MNIPFRVGIGHDIHALVEGRELWLGGVKIPFNLGLQGHSDADALITPSWMRCSALWLSETSVACFLIPIRHLRVWHL